MSLRTFVEPDEDDAWTHAYPHPRNNPDMVGHHAAEAQLRTAWESGRMPHGWLITGAPGLGKATLAYRLARFVLSRSATVQPVDLGPGLFGAVEAPANETGGDSLFVSPDNAAARRVARGAHADMLSVERTWNEKTKKLRADIGIAEIRRVGQALSLTPGEGAWRVVVVDTADDLTINAANALLKMLEEPPTRTLMLLTSANPGRLLPTIRSRCRRLDLKPLAADDVTQALGAMAPDADPADRDAAVALAGGSPGRALELVEQGGLAVFADLMASLNALADGRPDARAQSKVIAAIGKTGADAAVSVFFDSLQTTVHGVCALAAGRPAPTADAAWGHPATLDVCRKLAAQGSLDRWLAVWDNLGHVRRQLASLNLDRRQVGQSLMWSIERAAAA